jgi:tyrosine-protein phosphatase YwqE
MSRRLDSREPCSSCSRLNYMPVITHPERLSWIEDHYATFIEMARQGAWLQVTAGSLTGRFGEAARYWGERLLDEGWVHLLATDSHGADRRPPLAGGGTAGGGALGGRRGSDAPGRDPAPGNPGQ